MKKQRFGKADSASDERIKWEKLGDRNDGGELWERFEQRKRWKWKRKQDE
jgi:hypothetical protein